MLWLFSLVFCLGSGNAASQNNLTPKMVNGILGESVTLPVELPSGEEDTLIVWHYNGRAIVIIQLHKLQKPEFMEPDPKWKKRLDFTQSYSLKLNNLMMADTGHYMAQITNNGTVLLFSYSLRIFRRLRNLQVTNQIQLSGNGTCEVHLTCSVDHSNYTGSIGWQVPGSIFLSQPNLTISWDPKNSSEQNYICIAVNPVSNVSFSVSAKSLCEGVLTEEHLSWNSILIIIAPLAIVTVIVVFFVVWRKRRDSLSFPTQHVAESSPGSTVYAQVTHPNQKMKTPTPSKNNDSVTIYSIINHSREKEPRETALNNTKQVAKRP